MTNVTVAATQMSCTWDREANLDKAERLIRQAAGDGANIVLVQEMFSDHFFGFGEWDPAYFKYAGTADDHPVLDRMEKLARDLGVVLPVSFMERANNAHYNSVMIINADGRRLGVYRKSHIPLGPPNCYEKYYYNIGDTGFRTWDTQFGRIGVAICWDQWFPEAARAMALDGAEVFFYPTGIGTDCHGHWQRTIQGHAAANMVPAVVSNRVGAEEGSQGTTHFWGRSFITDGTGEVVAEADNQSDCYVSASFDLEAHREKRLGWGLFRDRRPDLYTSLLTNDGVRSATASSHPSRGPE